MPAVFADKYFAEHQSKAGAAVETIEARPVKPGDSIIINVGFNIMTRAEESGWQLSQGSVMQFFNDKEFAEQFEKVDFEKLTRHDLPADAVLRAVDRGDTVITHPFGNALGVQSAAPSVGWLVEIDGRANFFSDISFRATFNTQAAPRDPAQQICIEKNAPPTAYIILDRAVTFAFKGGDYEAPAGSVLFKNENDEDGYTALPKDDFTQRFLVTKPAYDAAEMEFLKGFATLQEPEKKAGRLKVPKKKTPGK